MGTRYVLVTPARNEAQFIELTLRSVISQTVQPIRWIIVSDGSHDGTDDIVRRYTAEHDWIRLVRMPDRAERHFAGKVHAFNAGYAMLADVHYDFIGSLDADISFDQGYFSYLLEKLSEDKRLGIVGTPFKDSDMYDYRFVSLEHVSGACQLFRRTCFEEIGGYSPSKNGGVDHIAVLKSRMKGWRTRTFTDRICIHHRDMGSASHGIWKARFKVGALDYALGGHPLWEIFRTVYQMSRRPYVVGGLLVFAGYLSAAFRREPRPIPGALVQFRRREQLLRLRALLCNPIALLRHPQDHQDDTF